MSPAHRSHGVSSSSPTAFSTAYSQTWHFYLCAYTAKDVPVQGREKGERAGVWLWEMSTWQLRPQGLRLLGGKRFLWMEVFIPSPLLLKFRLGRLSLTLVKPRIAICEQEAAPCSPGSWVTYPYLHQTERCCSFERLL